MSCTLSAINNHTKGFDFEALFSVYLQLNQTCAPESEIFFSGTRMLTDAVCRKVTGTSDSIWNGWTPYPIADIWGRIVTWKLPLFQLVSQFPRPPFGATVETANLAHLLGDPIDSITSMLLTLAMCHSRVELAKQVCIECGIGPTHPEYCRTWKALSIIMVSYDECGKPESVQEFCRDYLNLGRNEDADYEIRNLYEETAYALAADRSTKSLPIVFAEMIFIGGWIIALLKAASSNPNPANWANVEAHSVAFSSLYLWVTSAVVFGSIIGVSQTEGSIPRLLQGFEYHLAEMRECRVRRPSAAQRDEIKWCKMSIERAIHGGVLSWRPTKWRYVPTDFGVGTISLVWYSLIAVVSVGASLLTAALLSYFVPPRGPCCRHIPETLVFITWLLSFAVECMLERWLQKGLFWAVFFKDSFFGLSNIGIIIITQWGIMNSCSCWSTWGLTGLHLPQIPGVVAELMGFIKHVAPWIVFMGILLQLLFCACVASRYWDAIRVFIQRDDGASNLAWGRRKYERKTTRQDE